MKELIVQGASLHSISSKYHTPFMALLKSCYFLEYFEPSVPKSINLASIGSSVSAFDDQESIEDPVIGIHRWSLWQYWKPSHVLYTWLKWLRESGVDLHEYGRKETDLHQQGLVRWNWRSFPSSRKRWFLTNLTYGPSPSDWKLDLEIRHEDASESVAKVPGEWIEDDFGEQTEDISVEKEEPHEHEE